MPHDLTRLLVSCPDRPGIVAAVSRFLFEAGANIMVSDQYTSDRDGSFFLRMEFRLPLTDEERARLGARFATEVAGPLDMQWRTWPAGRPKRIAVLVSRYEHCLLDLMWRARRGDLEGRIGLVVSNHPDLAADVEAFDVPFVHVPVDASRKAEAERRLLELLAGRFDLVILARYMQILSGAFLAELGMPVINIHHSFLPAFAGADPYEQAKRRGVKLVGATAHYVTTELDAGPIIEQDVIRVTHADDARALERVGADIERTVLARAVHWHCEDRVVWAPDGTTIVF